MLMRPGKWLPYLAIAALPLAPPLAAAETGSPALADVAWMAGEWAGDALGGRVEERWSGIEGGSMVGSFRLLREGRLQMVEFLMIVAEEDGVVYRFKHYSTEMEPWEEKPLTFRLVAADGERAVFEGSPEQSPHRLTYLRRGPDGLTVQVGSADGGFELELQRSGENAAERQP